MSEPNAFAGLAAQALAGMAPPSDAPQAPPPAAAPPPQGVPVAPSAEAAPAPQSEPVAPATGEPPQPIKWEFPDDQLIDFGNGHIVTARQARQEGLLLSDYTRKTQALAAERKAHEEKLALVEKYEQERQALDRFLTSPEHVVQYALTQLPPEKVVAQLQMHGFTLREARQAVAEAQSAPTQSTPQGTPAMAPTTGETVTVEQLQQVVGQLHQQYQQQVAQLQTQAAEKTQALIQEKLQEVEDQKALQTYQTFLDSQITSLVESHPLLKVTPHAKQVFEFAVMQRQPQTVEDLQTILKDEARGMIARYQQAFELSQKVQAVAPPTGSTAPAPVQMAPRGIEPPGGAALAPQVVQFQKPDGSVDWNKLSGSAAQFLQQSSGF